MGDNKNRDKELGIIIIIAAAFFLMSGMEMLEFQIFEPKLSISEYRKKYNISLAARGLDEYKTKRDGRKIVKHLLIPVLLKARSYYNRYLKSLKQ